MLDSLLSGVFAGFLIGFVVAGLLSENSLRSIYQSSHSYYQTSMGAILFLMLLVAGAIVIIGIGIHKASISD